MCKMLLNEELSGVELYFEGKPAKTILTDLKANGYRYNSKKVCWYAKQNEESLKIANIYSEGVQEVTAPATKKSNKIDLFELTTFTEVKREKNYNTKEIAKEIRTAIKARFKFIKFSVTSKSSINITIKAAPFAVDSIYLKAVQEYVDKLVNSYNFCTCYDPYGDYGSSYNFYFFGCKVDYDFVQTEPTTELIEAMKDFDIKAAEAEELKRAEEERQYQEYLKEQEEARKAAEERQAREKQEEEYIYNNIEVIDIEESQEYFVKNAQFAHLNKNNTLDQYKKEVEVGAYYLNTLKVEKEIHFKDLKSLKLFENMLLNDFDFIDHTGGSYTKDLRINSMSDYYNMTEEERKSIQWILKGIGVYYNNELIFVIDAQGYSYCRYVGLIGTMTTIEKEIEYNQVVDAEEVEELKKAAEEITSVFNKVVEVNSLNDWYNTRRKFIEELKNNTLLSFNKQVVQQVQSEEVKNYMYRVLKENDNITDQFIDNKFTAGEKLTIIRESAIGGASVNYITFNTYEEVEAYNKKALKMTLGIKNKKGLYSTIIENDKVLIYRGWLDIPVSVLYEDTGSGSVLGSMTKYGSYDTKALDAIINYLSDKNILPAINTYKPIF